MKTISILLLLLFFFTDLKQPANNKAESFTVQTGDKFYDSGGPNADYLNCSEGDYCISNSILCGTGVVSLVFNSFALFPSPDGDRLRIYSGAEELYSSLSGISPVGRIFTSKDSTGCLIVVFMSTSIGAAAGWDADIIVTGTTTSDPEAPTLPAPSCNLVCKANVTITPGIYSPFDFIMNPGPCSENEYILEFMYPEGTHIFVPPTTLDASHIGLDITYKVWVKDRSNHCWGTIKD